MINDEDKDKRFLIVWDATEGAAIEEFSYEEDAMKLAREEAEKRLGHTIVVFEPKEAFKAAAQTSKVYLQWPNRPEVEKPKPPADERPHIFDTPV